jgi:hypothetical protein
MIGSPTAADFCTAARALVDHADAVPAFVGPARDVPKRHDPRARGLAASSLRPAAKGRISQVSDLIAVEEMNSSTEVHSEFNRPRT